jgi:hypothetical protein
LQVSRALSLPPIISCWQPQILLWCLYQFSASS